MQETLDRGHPCLNRLRGSPMLQELQSRLTQVPVQLQPSCNLLRQLLMTRILTHCALFEQGFTNSRAPMGYVCNWNRSASGSNRLLQIEGLTSGEFFICKSPTKKPPRRAVFFWLREQDLNLRPSGYEPDELPGCSIPRQLRAPVQQKYGASSLERYVFKGLTRFGGDLLSHALRRSTIGAKALNGRVRDGTGCFALAMTTKPRKTLEFQVAYAV